MATVTITITDRIQDDGRVGVEMRTVIDPPAAANIPTAAIRTLGIMMWSLQQLGKAAQVVNHPESLVASNDQPTPPGEPV